jgi:hypothetical protein
VPGFIFYYEKVPVILLLPREALLALDFFGFRLKFAIKVVLNFSFFRHCHHDGGLVLCRP